VALPTIGQVRRRQIVQHRLGPAGVWHFGIQQPRRPAPPENRTSADTVSQPRKTHWITCIPREAPNFVLGQVILAWAAGVEAKHWYILYMLGQNERSALEHQNALCAVSTSEPEVFSKRCTERAATYDNEVKRSQVAASGQTRGRAGIRINSNECFVVGVAYIATEHVAGERGVFSCESHREWRAESCFF